MINSSTSQSCKNIWVLLSGSSVLKSNEFIGTLLKQNAPHLMNGLNYYKVVENGTDIKSMVTKQLPSESKIPIDFVEKMSRLLSLEPLDACQLFQTYLQYEYRGTPTSANSLFATEKSIHNLLLQLFEFYNRERLFTLFNCKQILGHWHETSDHPYQALFGGFMDAVNDSHAVFRSLVQQLESVLTTKAPNKSKNGPYTTDALIGAWIRQNLRETFELLQNLLLYLEHIEIDAVLFERLLILFQSHAFFTRYPYSKQVNGMSDMLKYERLMHFISFTMSVVIVRAMRLDLICLSENSQANQTHYLLQSNQTASMSDLNKLIIDKCTSIDSYAPVLLSWLIVRSAGERPDHEQLEYLGNTAFRLNVFETINSALMYVEQEQLSASCFSSTFKLTIGQLLSSFFCEFDLDILRHKSALLLEIGVRLFNESRLVRQMLKKRLDCGLYMFFAKTFSNLLYNLSPALELCGAIGKADDKQLLPCILKQLPFLIEHYDSNKHFVSTEQPGVYQLNDERRIFGDASLQLKAGTYGMPKNLSPSSLTSHHSHADASVSIEWHDVELDGLRILCHVYRDRMEKLFCQIGYSNNAVFVSDMNTLNGVFGNLFESNCKNPLLQSIPAQLFHSFRLFTKLPKVPRHHMASTLQFFSALIRVDRTTYETQIWDVIQESGFFPYMIGLINDRREIACGRDTNAARLGEVIMFEECIEGNYDLCCAYLDLLSQSFPSNESFATSLLVHVMSELFPSFQQWHFHRTSEYKRIAFRCLSIFQRVLSLPRNHILPDLARIALLSGPAGETLLGIIVKGEQLVRDCIESTGCSTALANDHLTTTVRLSLCVLNRLLVLQEKQNNDSFKKSSVEQALFSTQASKPNMILVLTQYVFQRYDPRLATLAVTLLKRLSKHFPMSLLACLGSEAESVRDHFLYRLEETTEDIMLKIALLDFLSCCIKHQPGLIEMFLNSEQSEFDASNNNNKSNLVSVQKTTAQNCLKTVLDILKDKHDYPTVDTGPSELHSAAIKFVFTFWIQPHLLAIDSLKKTDNLWQLICFPLLKEITNIDQRLFGHILKILARELFYVRTLEKPVDKSLQSIFGLLCESNRLIQLSDYIGRQCEVDGRSNPVHYLLSGWRDFLVSVSKFQPVVLESKTLKHIFNNLLDSLAGQLQRLQEPAKRNDHDEMHADQQLLQTLSDCCVLLLRKHGCSVLVQDDCEQFQRKTSDILYAVSEKKELLTMGFLVSIQSLLSLSLKAFDKGDLALREPLKNWYNPWCLVFKFVYQVLEKNVQAITEIDLRLANSTLGLFHCLVNLTQDVDISWLTVIRNHLVLESMVTLLCYLIEHYSNFQLVETILHTFILLSTVPSLAHLLQIMRIMDKISASINCALIKPETDREHIFELMLQLASSLLITTKHHFVDTTITLIRTHQNAFVRCLKQVRESPDLEHVQEAIYIAALLTALTPFKEVWITLDTGGYEQLFTEILKTTHSLIAFLIRPNLLQYSLRNRASLNSRLLVNSNDTNDKVKEDRNVSRVISFDLDVSNQLDYRIHRKMFELLLQNLMFLNQLTSGLPNIMNRNNNNLKTSLETVFTAPNIDADKIASFGSLLYCISLVIRLLNKFEKSNESSEPNPVQQFTSKEQLTLILETSLTLLISQALIAQKSIDLTDRDKQTIRRDLKTELGSMLLPKSRNSKRNLNISLNSSLHKTPDSSIVSNNFIKALMDQLDELFPN